MQAGSPPRQVSETEKEPGNDTARRVLKPVRPSEQGWKLFSNAASPITTSSAFDAALAPITSSPNALLIHSDAIFLPT